MLYRHRHMPRVAGPAARKTKALSYVQACIEYMTVFVRSSFCTLPLSCATPHVPCSKRAQHLNHWSRKIACCPPNVLTHQCHTPPCIWPAAVLRHLCKRASGGAATKNLAMSSPPPRSFHPGPEHNSEHVHPNCIQGTLGVKFYFFRCIMSQQKAMTAQLGKKP